MNNFAAIYYSLFPLQMLSAGSEEELGRILESCEWRFEIEGLPSYVKFEHLETFVKEVSLYYAVIRTQGMIDQFVQGFMTYEVCLCLACG